MSVNVWDKPKFEGLYAADTINGWRVLEWSAGAWWFKGKVAKWGAKEPRQCVGPLTDFGLEPEPAAKQEYDL